MKIEEMEFLDWLHKIRKESELERKRRGLTGSEWLKEVKKEAEKIMSNFDTSKKKSEASTT
jgi:hypothetical protein